MNKRIEKIIFICLVLTIFIISSFTLIILLKVQKENINSIKIEQMNSEKFVFELYFKQIVQEAVINEGISIPVGEKNVPYIPLTNKPLLVFRYSALSCNECIEFGNRKLNAFFKNYKNNDNLLFIVSDYMPQFENKIHYSYYLDLQKEKLNLPIENSNVPFYCIVINNSVRHIFIPDQNYPEYTDIYLQEIKRRYFPNE